MRLDALATHIKGSVRVGCYLPSTITYSALVRVLVWLFVLGDLQYNRFRLNGDNTVLCGHAVRQFHSHSC